MVTISNRDKNMIIWNFMEELCDKDQNASENNLPTDFKLKDFYNMEPPQQISLTHWCQCRLISK
jgi:hypothetical protein